MVNISLVCQSVPREPLQARVSKGAVATAITACGFVTIALPKNLTLIGLVVATAITACGFVTKKRIKKWKAIYGCNSDYRLRFCNILQQLLVDVADSCNSDYRLRFCNNFAIISIQICSKLQQRLPLAVL